jgi:hypothetical protein
MAGGSSGEAPNGRGFRHRIELLIRGALARFATAPPSSAALRSSASVPATELATHTALPRPPGAHQWKPLMYCRVRGEGDR